MSDGPHRSLPMSSSWKRTAEFADNLTHGGEEVCKAAVAALHKDWISEVSPIIMRKIQDLLKNPSFFLEDQFEHLRQLAVGRPVANYLLDCLNFEVASGSSGQEALVRAITSSVIDRSARAIRQIQEHYIRKSNFPRSEKVVQRISKSLHKLGFEALAHQILSPNRSAKSLHVKKTGLDDGVSL